MAMPLLVPHSPHLEGHVEGFGGARASGPYAQYVPANISPKGLGAPPLPPCSYACYAP